MTKPADDEIDIETEISEIITENTYEGMMEQLTKLITSREKRGYEKAKELYYDFQKQRNDKIRNEISSTFGMGCYKVMPTLKEECLHDFKRGQLRYHGHVLQEVDHCYKCGFEKVILDTPVSFMTQIEKHTRSCY